MPETPRTWTLSGMLLTETIKPPIATGEIVEVVEASVVADLLERLQVALEMAPQSESGPEEERDQAVLDAEALLRVLRPEGQA